jgi:putative radical SAM enzyme (TIGR03279 family)
VKDSHGLSVAGVRPRSAAARAGIARGDVLVSINGRRLEDSLDYLYHKSEPELNIVLRRHGRRQTVRLHPPEGEDPGLELGPFRIRTCRNNCVFCFVAQLPRGLRRSLYVKDEDYRMSFLYGNYITLTNLSEADRKRIARLRLSPLYISVHTTDPALRARMLGNPAAGDVMKDLRFFRDHKIRMHAQIVLCPGLNDGRELERTIRELHSLHPYLLSIAVVPVGLTAHRKTKLQPVRKDDAASALESIGAFQRRFMKKHGSAVVYGADELYIKAGRPFPPLKEYGDLHQLENGVGMVPLFLWRARKIKSAPPSPLRYLTFTGRSFHPYLRKFTDRLARHGLDITPVMVENSFFGESVTVTGLLTGRDVIMALAGNTDGYDALVIPDEVLREGRDVFLDDVTVKDMENALGLKTVVVESTPEGLLKGVAE